MIRLCALALFVLGSGAAYGQSFPKADLFQGHFYYGMPKSKFMSLTGVAAVGDVIVGEGAVQPEAFGRCEMITRKAYWLDTIVANATGVFLDDRLLSLRIETPDARAGRLAEYLEHFERFWNVGLRHNSYTGYGFKRGNVGVLLRLLKFDSDKRLETFVEFYGREGTSDWDVCMSGKAPVGLN